MVKILSFIFLIFSALLSGGCDSTSDSHSSGYRITSFETLPIKGNFDIEAGEAYPDSLAPIYPNPFNRAFGSRVINIHFTLKDTALVKLIVQNAIGDSVVMFQDSIMPPGTYGGEWEPINSFGEALRSGIYFITLRADPGLRNYISSRLFYIENND